MLRIVVRVFKYLPVLLLCIATLALYIPSIDTGYFADDFDFAVRYQGGEPFLRAFTRNTDGTGGGGSWRPLTAASLWLTMQAESPAFDHLISLLLYVALVVMVYAVARELFPKNSAWFAAGIAFIFASLPSHAEAIIWVAARADLLAALGGVGALLLWLRGYPWWALGALVFSWLSKEFWILFGGALFFIPNQDLTTRRSRAMWALGFLSAGLVWFAARYFITQYGIGGYSITDEQRVFGIQHLANELISFTMGVWSYGEVQSLLIRFSQHYWFIIVWILAAGYSALGYFAYINKQLRIIVLGLVTTLTPMLLLSIPMIRPEASVAEQRYWFAPSFFVILLLAYVTAKKSERVACVIILVAMMFGIAGSRHNIKLHKQAAEYRDEIVQKWHVNETALSQAQIFGLPDTWHGVHLFASPFFERALMWYGLKSPTHVGEWFQWCTTACRVPAQVTVAAREITFTSTDPRIFSARSRGLRHSVIIPPSSSRSYAFWTGTEWRVIPPTGVEKANR